MPWHKTWAYKGSLNKRVCVAFSLLHTAVRPFMVVDTHTTPTLGFNRDGVVFFSGTYSGIMGSSGFGVRSGVR